MRILQRSVHGGTYTVQCNCGRKYIIPKGDRLIQCRHCKRMDDLPALIHAWVKAGKPRIKTTTHYLNEEEK